MKTLVNYIFLVSIFFMACSSPAKDGHDHEDTPTGDTSILLADGIVSLTGDQMETIGISFGQIEKKALSASLKVNGRLKVPNQNKAFVTASFPGIVRTITVQAGDFVNKGKVIATVANPELLRMQQNLQQVNAEIKLAEIELERQRQLVEGNAAPLKRMQQAESHLTTLRSQRSGLQKQLSGLGTSSGYSEVMQIRAPISGTISKVISQIGSHVDMMAPIAEIVNNSHLHVDLFVYEKDLPKVHKGQLIHFTLTNNPGKEYDAAIHSIGTAFEGESKSVPVHALVTGNKEGLIDGMDVTAMISMDTTAGDAVPEKAIVSVDGRDFIFIEKTASPDSSKASTNGKAQVLFRRVPVAAGTNAVGYTQITLLEEVPPSAKVVVQNAFFLQARMQGAGEEHAH